MHIKEWFVYLSKKQHILFFSTILFMVLIAAAGYMITPPSKEKIEFDYSTAMSIKDLASKLGVTGKALAKELKLPLDAPKAKSLKRLDVTDAQLERVVEHLLSHIDTTVKYYIYAALSLGGLIYLLVLGIPETAPAGKRRLCYPPLFYTSFMTASVILTGFMLGKSPNPMEGIVKVFKSMVGLYPDPVNKVSAFIFFIILAIIGNKIICGWACPMGALQELIYKLPIFKKIKSKKLPFVLTNAVRAGIFTAMLLFLFGVIGGKRGMVIYHYVNPFNLFNLEFELESILSAVIVILIFSFFTYRPFCQFVCPFGLVSWIAERISIFRIRIDKKKCTECGACIKACPLEAAKGRVMGKLAPADCFSCARCLNICPVDAVRYGPVFK
jgi:NAD-dependent dihydropyrimidine dehydrogenase PreA subunit